MNLKLEIRHCLPREALAKWGKLEIPAKRGGQSLIEVLIALGLASILLPALLTGLVASREGKAQEAQRLQATALAQEAQEITRNVREKGWSNIPTSGGSPYHPQATGTSWSLASGAEPISQFTRKIDIADVRRDPATGNIVTSGGQIDPSTKKLVTTVAWNTPYVSQVDSILYLSRFLNNNTWIQTNQTDFDAGTHNGTKTVPTGGGPDAQVELNLASSTTDYGNKFLVDPTTSGIVDMQTQFFQTGLTFTAQSPKTVKSVKLYVHTAKSSPLYKVSLQTDDGTGLPSGIPLSSGTFQPQSAGWQTINISPNVQLAAGTKYYIMVEWQSGQINNGHYISIRQSTPLNKLYPKTGATDSNANTYSYLVIGRYYPTPQNGQPIYVLEFTDNSLEGNPFNTGDQSPIRGALFQGEQFQVDSNKTISAVKLYLRKNSSSNPTDNLYLTLETTAGQKLIDNVTVMTPTQPSTSFAYYTYNLPQTQTLTTGTTYRLYLSSPGSAQTRTYEIKRDIISGVSNLNDVTYDGTNSLLTLTFNSGANWGTNGAYDWAGFYFTVQNQDTTNGDYTSQTFNAGASAAFNNITWTATTPGTTGVKFQVAIDNTSPPTNFFGPSGTSTDYFTTPSAIIPFTNVNGQYLRFRAFLTGDGFTTPTLSDVTINYSP